MKNKEKQNQTKQNKKGSGAFAPFLRPSEEEVAQYCLQRGGMVDARLFCDHYDANGWMVGSSAMRDWRAAVRVWEKKRFGSAAVVASAKSDAPSSYDICELEQRILHVSPTLDDETPDRTRTETALLYPYDWKG